MLTRTSPAHLATVPEQSAHSTDARALWRNIFASDTAFFAAHPELSEFSRAFIPGEFGSFAGDLLPGSFVRVFLYRGEMLRAPVAGVQHG